MDVPSKLLVKLSRSLFKAEAQQQAFIHHLIQPQAYPGSILWCQPKPCPTPPIENEQVCDWFLKRFPTFHAMPVPHLQAYQSHLSPIPCYRMWPRDHLGAGAYLSVCCKAKSLRSHPRFPNPFGNNEVFPLLRLD